MELYYAPMEGITGYLHRNVSRAVFPDIEMCIRDRYLTQGNQNYDNNLSGTAGKRKRTG